MVRITRTTGGSLLTMPCLLARTPPLRITMDDLPPAQVLDFSRERMADRSNGILEFSVNHDFQDANVFHFWERYTSNASLGQHNTQPEVTQFMENVRDSTNMVACLLSAELLATRQQLHCVPCMELSCICWQVQEHTERPVGMALYEMKNGQISNICIQGGDCCCSTSIVTIGVSDHPRQSAEHGARIRRSPAAW